MSLQLAPIDIGSSGPSPKKERKKKKSADRKEKEEKFKKYDERQGAKKERDMKKKIDKKLRKLNMAPENAHKSFRDLSTILLADYEKEKCKFSLIDEFLSDFLLKLSKHKQKILSVYEERDQVVKDFSDFIISMTEKAPMLCKKKPLKIYFRFFFNFLFSFLDHFFFGLFCWNI